MSVPDGGSTVATPPFEFGVRVGIVFIVESASLSALAVTSLLLYIAYSAIAIKRGASRTWTVSTHIHYYFVNLLVSDLIQAIGGLIDIKWIIDARVTEGPLCTAQGILKQMGDVGVALTSLTIALHTFFVLVFRWHSAPRTALWIIALIWIFIALIIGISNATHKGDDYYGNTQYWCWITEDYGRERIGLEYIWLWLACLVNLICYVAIALVIKGIVVVDGTRIRIRRRSTTDADTFSSFTNTTRSEGVQSKSIAMQMLFYPAVYIITVFPIAVVRWMAFSGKDVPFAATAFASILFSSSGLLNVILFKFTRPKLMPNRTDRMDGNSKIAYPHLPNLPSYSHLPHSSLSSPQNSSPLQNLSHSSYLSRLSQSPHPGRPTSITMEIHSRDREQGRLPGSFSEDYEIEEWKVAPRTSPMELPTLDIRTLSPAPSRSGERTSRPQSQSLSSWHSAGSG